jgi:hypothetical protein
MQEPTYRPQQIVLVDIKKHFYEVFNDHLPDIGFAKSWCSMPSECRKAAMNKAKLWLDKRPDKTVLDAARIVSALLRDERNIARRRLQVETQQFCESNN